MKQNINFREIKPKDYAPLAKIISDTWSYERFCLPKTAKHMAKLYLASCLTEQTFTCVAVENDEPIGIIMGKDEKNHHVKLKYKLLLAISTAALLFSKDGRRVAKLFGGFEEIDKAMLAQSKTSFDGQLSFFAVKADKRGTGTGIMLYEKFCDYNKENGIKNFYLYTDSKCNYKFYERRGLTRINETICNLKPHADEELQMFLYAYISN